MLLVGCAKTPAIVDTQVDGRMPEPYKACTVKPKVIIKDEVAYVGLTYEDSVEQAICEERKLTYIKQLQDILCSYRKDCPKEKNE